MISKSKIPLTMKDFRIAIIEYLLIDNIKYQEYKSQMSTSQGSHLIEKTGNQRLCMYKDCKSRPIYGCDTCKKSLCPEFFKPFHDDL